MAPAKDKASRVRLVIDDIDGTLITKEKLLTPRSVKAVKKLGEADIIFGVTTGRPPAGVKMLVHSLYHLRFIAGFNGGVIVNPKMEVFQENCLPSEIAKQVAETIAGYQMDVWLYTDKDWFVRDPQAYRVDTESNTVQ